MNTDEFEGHTPAPWKMHKISGGSAFGYLTVMMSDGQQIKQMYGMNGADARLIAAAPELLAEVLWIQKYEPNIRAEVLRLREGIKRLLNEGSPDRIWVHNTDLRELIE